MDVVLRSDPFPHLAARAVLDPESADGALRRLTGPIDWVFKTDTFYSHFGVDLQQYCNEPEFEPLVRREYVAALKALVEAAFSVKLQERYLLWAHKLADGQGIGPHNDNDPEEFRFVLQLGIERPSMASGFLLLFDKDGMPQRAYPPTHNSAVCFNTNDTSYHAVTEVAEQERYSVIYVFSSAPSASGQ